MAANGNPAAEALLEQLRPDILKAFASIPPYGSLGFTVHLVEGQPVRVEWAGSIQRKLAPKASR
jgi:hypothetical protein